MQNPPVPPPPRLLVRPPSDGVFVQDPTNAWTEENWRDRERRQRTVRVLMMFLLMLLLVDDEAGSPNRLRGRSEPHKNSVLEQAVFKSRLQQEQLLHDIAQKHSRYKALVGKNGGKDIEAAVEEYAISQSEMEKDEFEQQQQPRLPAEPNQNDPEAEQKVFHYPWNSTGFYRGEWTLLTDNNTEKQKEAVVVAQRQLAESNEKLDTKLSATQLQDALLNMLQTRNESAGVLLLPEPYRIHMRDDNNLTSTGYDNVLVDNNGKIVPTLPKSWAKTVTLTRESGRAAFQLYSRSVPGMRELSLVNGFVKLYDSVSPGYSTRKDVLVRVRGVLFHSIGKLSLVSPGSVDMAALVMDANSTHHQRRRRLLQKAVDSGDVQAARTLLTKNKSEGDPSYDLNAGDTSDQDVVKFLTSPADGTTRSGGEGTIDEDDWSNIVVPFPFVRDDSVETIRRARTPASRIMPIREQALELNAANCGFEINMDVSEIEWTVGAWRKLVGRRVEELKRLDPSLHHSENAGRAEQGVRPTFPGQRHRRARLIQDQALVMDMVGTIHSPNCNFTAFLNTTALRTDWDATTSKAINYSFYMMLVCLTQILILLRQLLHSQSQSTATRVSLLCIGWQTILDALLCLAHIYLSLALHPLFTAFASVAFFKLLIFCVIEMKYMAIVIQARNSSNGGQPAEVLRRQVAMLHLRFYVGLLATFLLLFYAMEKYRVYCLLLLYSFWVPQIVMNIITEARTPMHKYYVYGMSITRLVAPFYIFALEDNFLKEVYPESPTDVGTVFKLVVWVGIQAATLIAQGKYGARFMIPARFLPPKFDYSRPIPASMLPQGALELPTPELMEERDDALRPKSRDTSPQPTCRHQTAETTRSRYRATRTNSNSPTMTTETHSPPVNAPAPTLECSICYDPIDVRDRQKYMLAPCNHLFHRECLSQWMDIKTECPICRTELPAL